MKKIKKKSKIKVELTILPEFEQIVDSVNMNISLTITSNDNSFDGHPQMGVVHQEKIAEIERSLFVKRCSIPFNVWKQRNRKIIVDGRHDEYRAVKKLGLPVKTVEHEFASKNEARAFLILQLLKSPKLSSGKRILLALNLKGYYEKRARRNKGRRNDLRDKTKGVFTPVNTNKELARIANVGEQMVLRMRQLVESGPEILGKKKTEDLISSILQENLSVNAGWNRYSEARKAQNKVIKFAKAQKSRSAAKKGRAKNTKDAYVNPSLKDGFQDKLVYGDSAKVLKKIPDKSVNLVGTSCPYNAGIPYDVYNDSRSESKYYGMLAKVWTQCARILRDRGRLVINVGAMVSQFPNSKDRFNTPFFMKVIEKIRELDCSLKFRDMIIWNKQYQFGKSLLGTVGSPKNPVLAAMHEYLIVFSKNNWEMEPEIINAPSDMTKHTYKELTSSVWDIYPISKVGHPAPFPEKLAEWIIRLYSYVGDTVVDPFLGSGTVSAVAARLGRHYFGCDLSQEYVKQAAIRTEKARRQWLKQVNSKNIKLNTAASKAKFVTSDLTDNTTFVQKKSA